MAHVRSRKFAILEPVGANPILVLVHKLLTTKSAWYKSQFASSVYAGM